ncbi:MAG: sulfurtransferase [Bdellovibrionales bacterium CG12_big_fil_rev_8_21_14_0_65_38_15]|nr:MAG: sulfurtransferase [Bdellovibrionales bacterium CG22_combo_CG10-13_8_21_14_all_38_13]PIQ54564.1 MAG: sulfurtransferase [Bdellovibrionales bacterium CG12_big_fil_rev_8_21_14_0_65_38_15]PIR29945.1 MAG: sulfurtransferase [Bdellovibrionales bacterium CG11_big_fil_rev_8_21_14_0_20_38_13]
MIKSMEVSELQEKLGKDENLVLVDVREQAEWDEAHIDGAVFLPLSQLEARFDELPKDKSLILQCRSGKRSMNAAIFLKDNGYSDLTNLEGGIMAWMDEGFDVND